MAKPLALWSGASLLSGQIKCSEKKCGLSLNSPPENKGALAYERYLKTLYRCGRAHVALGIEKNNIIPLRRSRQHRRVGGYSALIFLSSTLILLYADGVPSSLCRLWIRPGYILFPVVRGDRTTGNGQEEKLAPLTKPGPKPIEFHDDTKLAPKIAVAAMLSLPASAGRVKKRV